MCFSPYPFQKLLTLQQFRNSWRGLAWNSLSLSLTRFWSFLSWLAEKEVTLKITKYKNKLCRKPKMIKINLELFMIIILLLLYAIIFNTISFSATSGILDCSILLYIFLLSFYKHMIFSSFFFNIFVSICSSGNHLNAMKH